MVLIGFAGRRVIEQTLREKLLTISRQLNTCRRKVSSTPSCPGVQEHPGHLLRLHGSQPVEVAG